MTERQTWGGLCCWFVCVAKQEIQGVYLCRPQEYKKISLTGQRLSLRLKKQPEQIVVSCLPLEQVSLVSE